MCVNCDDARRKWVNGDITIWELERILGRCKDELKKRKRKEVKK